MPKLVTVVALTILTGCSLAPGATPGPPTPPPTPTPVVVDAACGEAVASLIDALTELDSRLSVGMNLQSYGTAVGDARVAYDRIQFDELQPVCIEQVGIPLENAFNEYVQAYQSWNSCIFDEDECTMDQRQPTLQRHWSAATTLLDEVQQVLP